MAPDNPSERWTVLVGDGAVLGGAREPFPVVLDQGVLRHDRLTMVPVSELEVALRERDEQRREAEQLVWSMGGQIGKLRDEVAELKRTVEEVQHLLNCASASPYSQLSERQAIELARVALGGLGREEGNDG